jgi:DNA-binding NarL/FixJ family response regulator
MPSIPPLRVLVVDDHVGIRLGIESLIDAEAPRMRSVGGAANPLEALHEAKAQQPDVVVLDVDLDGEDGLALIPLLHRAAPCAVVVLTSLIDPRVAERALRLGACGCVHKASPASELLARVAAAHDQRCEAAALTPVIMGSAMSRSVGSNNP